MPKAKKSSKKDTSSFIKKVASAGRGGDTGLAYLSPKARELLKKLGGAGTKNPKTGLKEYKAAARFAMDDQMAGDAPLTAEDALNEFNAISQAPVVEDTVRTQPTAENQIVAQQPDTARAAVEPESVAITPQQPVSQPQFQSPFTAQFDPSRLLQPGQALSTPAVSQEPVSTPAPAPGTAASDLSQFSNVAPASAGINLSGIGLGGSYMPGGPLPAGVPTNLNAAAALWEKYKAGLSPEAEEERRRAAAEEEARRIAAEEEARRKAAAEEAARRAAEEEARRRAEEQARYIAEQEAKSRLAAEEARRVAAEAEQRRLADEAARQRALQDAAARQAAEQEAARRAQEDAARRAQEEDAARAAQQEAARQAQEQASRQVQEQAARQQEEARRAAEEQARSTAAEEARKQGEAQKLMDEERKRLAAEQERRRELSARFSNLSNVDPNSDVGRLLSRFREATGARRPSSLTGGTTGEISPIAQQAGGIPTSSGSIPLPTSPISGAAGTSIPTTQIPTPGYQAAPLPQLVGAGTSTPFFQPSAGGLTPGTLPASQMPQSLRTSDIPLQAIAMNPNLTPTILGGAENLGYYMDRNGNIILSPGGVRPPGRAKGGPASDAELEQLLKDAEVDKDMSSAKAMLDELSSEPAQSKTEVSYSPNAQSIRRVSRRPIREETDRGTARGMAMELEQVTKTQGPRTKGQVEDMRQKMELLRNTLGMPTFSKANLAREGELMTRRFAEGGEAKGDLQELIGAVKEKLFGKDEEPEPTVQGSVPKPGPGTRRYFEERGKQLRGSPPVGIEREAQIRAKMGPEYADLVKENIGVTGMLGDPERLTPLQGVNFTPGTSKEQLDQYMRQKLEPVLSVSKNKTIPEGKRIFGIGRAASPQIYAHEIRHEEVGDEEYNRVLDLVNAGSRPAYEDQIDALYSYHMSSDPSYTEGTPQDKIYLRKQIPFKDKERYVLNKVSPMLSRYINKEAPPLSRKNEGKEALRSNYNLNALGAQGAFKETGEKLKQQVIEQRARYPFLNFIGRENMPIDQENFPLPDYLDPELRKKR